MGATGYRRQPPVRRRAAQQAGRHRAGRPGPGLAEAITQAVRGFVRDTAAGMLAELLDAAGIANTPELPCHAQLAAQLDGFPEVHWAAVPFAPLVQEGDGAPTSPSWPRPASPSSAAAASWPAPPGSACRNRSTLKARASTAPTPACSTRRSTLLDRLAASAKSVRAAPSVRTAASKATAATSPARPNG